MNICLNVVGGSGWIGGTIYIRHLAMALIQTPAAVEGRLHLSFAVPRRSRNELMLSLDGLGERVYDIGFFQRAILKAADLSPVNPFPEWARFLNKRKIDFFYPDTDGRRYPYKYGGWIPDFQHIHLPHFFLPGEIRIRDVVFKKIAKRAPVVVLSSHMAQNDFQSLFPASADRSRVLSFCSVAPPEWFEGDPNAVREIYDLADVFFIVCNQFWKHKDHDVVIEALGILKERGVRPTVVCTGATEDYRHPEYFGQLCAKIEKLGLSGQLRILGLIPRLDQIQLIRQSLAVIQPSLFEGWSTVVEDARALGKNIILSDFPVHLEQNPSHGVFFKRSDPEELADRMLTALDTYSPGPDLRREDAARKENLVRLKNHGDRFLGIVESVL